MCLFVTTHNAKAYSIYDGSINSTVLTYYKDIVSKLTLSEHYVLFRGSQYEYYLVTSKDLKLTSNYFSSTSATLYTINISNNYNSNYTLNVSSINDFSLSVGSSIVYIDLGYYPSLIERGVLYDRR